MVELIPFQLLVLYLVPFVVAAARHHDALVPILLVNLLLGWTGIGWLAALGWALTGRGRSPAAGPRSLG